MAQQFYRVRSTGQLYVRDDEPRLDFSGGFTVGELYGADDDDDDDEEFDDILFAGQEELKKEAKKARRAGGPRGKRKLKKLKSMAYARLAGGFAMPSRGDGYGMRLPLPFQASIASATALPIQLKPQNEFAVEELIFASQNAQFFDLEKFEVGTQNQFVGYEGGLNGDILSTQTLRKVSFMGSVATPGVLIYLTTRNTDSNTQILKGAVVGPTVRYGDRVAG